MSKRAAWIPEGHIKQLSLQKHGRATWAVYALILAQRNYSTGTFEGLQSQLAFDLGLSIRSVINAERELQEMGLIEITKNGRGRVIHTTPPKHAGSFTNQEHEDGNMQAASSTHASCFTNTCNPLHVDHYKKGFHREKDRARPRVDQEVEDWDGTDYSF